jgi:flagellar basal body-associated protein FliL
MAKLNEKRKKKKKKKAMLVLMLYILLGSLALTLFGNQKNLWFWVLRKKSQKNRRFSKRARARGAVREPAFSAAVIDCMSETDPRFLRSAAVVI